MKAIVHSFTTDIYPTDEEVKELCKVGQGADTCIWLLVSPEGWECCCKNRPIPLVDRWEAGLTIAKRDGCDRVRRFNPAGLVGKVEVPL